MTPMAIVALHRYTPSMKAAIFDIDGTLVDSVDLHAGAWQEAFAHFGHSIPIEQIRSQIGKGGDQLMPVFLSPDELKAKGERLEKFRGDLFKKKYLPAVKPFPKVRDLFQRFLSDGWKIALASSAKQDELKTYKSLCKIDDLLDTETSSADAEKSKPHPDIFLAAVERLKTVPSQCIVIGDSPYDAEAAKKAGIVSVGFLCGGFPQPELMHAGCGELYAGAADLLLKYERSLFAHFSRRTETA
ncbi:MAG: HAD family hydrolase [Nibricoccus sp.]